MKKSLYIPWLAQVFFIKTCHLTSKAPFKTPNYPKCFTHPSVRVSLDEGSDYLGGSSSFTRHASLSCHFFNANLFALLQASQVPRPGAHASLVYQLVLIDQSEGLFKPFRFRGFYPKKIQEVSVGFFRPVFIENEGATLYAVLSMVLQGLWIPSGQLQLGFKARLEQGACADLRVVLLWCHRNIGRRVHPLHALGPWVSGRNSVKGLPKRRFRNKGRNPPENGALLEHRNRAYETEGLDSELLEDVRELLEHARALEAARPICQDVRYLADEALFDFFKYRSNRPYCGQNFIRGVLMQATVLDGEERLREELFKLFSNALEVARSDRLEFFLMHARFRPSTRDYVRCASLSSSLPFVTKLLDKVKEKREACYKEQIKEPHRTYESLDSKFNLIHWMVIYSGYLSLFGKTHEHAEHMKQSVEQMNALSSRTVINMLTRRGGSASGFNPLHIKTPYVLALWIEEFEFSFILLEKVKQGSHPDRIVAFYRAQNDARLGENLVRRIIASLEFFHRENALERYERVLRFARRFIAEMEPEIFFEFMRERSEQQHRNTTFQSALVLEQFEFAEILFEKVRKYKKDSRFTNKVSEFYKMQGEAKRGGNLFHFMVGRLDYLGRRPSFVEEYRRFFEHVTLILDQMDPLHFFECTQGSNDLEPRNPLSVPKQPYCLALSLNQNRFAENLLEKTIGFFMGEQKESGELDHPQGETEFEKNLLCFVHHQLGGVVGQGRIVRKHERILRRCLQKALTARNHPPHQVLECAERDDLHSEEEASKGIGSPFMTDSSPGSSTPSGNLNSLENSGYIGNLNNFGDLSCLKNTGYIFEINNLGNIHHFENSGYVDRVNYSSRWNGPEEVSPQNFSGAGRAEAGSGSVKSLASELLRFLIALHEANASDPWMRNLSEAVSAQEFLGGEMAPGVGGVEACSDGVEPLNTSEPLNFLVGLHDANASDPWMRNLSEAVPAQEFLGGEMAPGVGGVEACSDGVEPLNTSELLNFLVGLHDANASAPWMRNLSEAVPAQEFSGGGISGDGGAEQCSGSVGPVDRSLLEGSMGFNRKRGS